MSYLMDPDEFVTCPYDSNHRVQVHRLQMHILKCKKNNPERSRNLVSCPFNALHLCYPNEIDEHMTKCLDAEHFLKPKTRPTELKGDLNVPTYVHRKAFNTETEDWDDENEEIPLPRDNSILSEIKQEKVEFEEKATKKSMGRGIAFDERLKPKKEIFAQLWRDA